MGKAYADNTGAEEMKEQRDNGIESKHRDNTIEQNLKFFDDMVAGKIFDYCIRAKMNMQDKVKCLRDPVFYRCKKDAVHHRTGTKYKAYPTYDLAIAVIDSAEGVTHALITVEYADRDYLYKWVQETLGLRKVTMYEFAKLNLVHTCLSKRKLKWFVENDHVSGWNDPRFPTVQGIMRRGMTVECLKDFMLEQGPSRNTNLMEWDKLWSNNKAIIDPVTARYSAINKDGACRLTIENGPEQT
jgi:glutamyl-tRNA synthetase